MLFEPHIADATNRLTTLQPYPAIMPDLAPSARAYALPKAADAELADVWLVGKERRRRNVRAQVYTAMDGSRLPAIDGFEPPKLQTGPHGRFTDTDSHQLSVAVAAQSLVCLVYERVGDMSQWAISVYEGGTEIHKHNGTSVLVVTSERWDYFTNGPKPFTEPPVKQCSQWYRPSLAAIQCLACTSLNCHDGHYCLRLPRPASNKP